MNDLIYIGKVTSFHGIKGEIKINSFFDYNDKAFKVGSHLIINNKSYEIKSYRQHKNHQMVTLNDFNNINQVLFLKDCVVYKEKSELSLLDDEVLDSDLIDYKCLTTDGKEAIIKEIFRGSKLNKVIRIDIAGVEHLLPVNSPLVKINKKQKIVTVELIDGM